MHLGEDHATSHTTDSSAQADASALYCRHWHSLCAFARSRGCESHDAEDAVQELFAKLVAQGQHERAASIADSREQAAFLIARLRTHLIKRWQYRTRLRRGGEATCFSLSDEEGRSIDVPDTHAAPDQELDRRWARGVIDRALQRVSGELQSQGRADVWVCLERNIIDGGRGEQPQTGALRVALHRAKRRLRGLICGDSSGGNDGRLLRAILA